VICFVFSRQPERFDCIIDNLIKTIPFIAECSFNWKLLSAFIMPVGGRSQCMAAIARCGCGNIPALEPVSVASGTGTNGKIPSRAPAPAVYHRAWNSVIHPGRYCTVRSQQSGASRERARESESDERGRLVPYRNLVIQRYRRANTRRLGCRRDCLLALSPAMNGNSGAANSKCSRRVIF
jgi:hypothetical protein